MALALIRLQQPPKADVPPGTARRDIVVGVPVILRNGDDAQVTSWHWTLLSKPPTSTAVILNPNSSIASITPDVRGGSYRLQLSINGGRKSHGEVQIIVFRVPDGAGFAAPAVGERGSESNYIINGNPNKASWADEFVRRYLVMFDNRDDPFDFNLNNGASTTIQIPWTLPDAMLQRVFLRGVSADLDLKFYADAGLTDLMWEIFAIDATGAGHHIIEHRTLTSVTGIAGTIYMRVTNNDTSGNQKIALRLGAM